MIKVNRINNEPFLVNCDLIEYVDEIPHTVIYMMSGRKLVVAETPDEIRRLAIEYKKKIFTADSVEQLFIKEELGADSAEESD
ncbi:MAG: flagellar FlbD family protein [Christensenellales bacterium]|jgi:flagellar protein FlbD